MTLTTSRRIRLPLHFIEGRWSLEFGGEVPVKEGSRAELAIAESCISDPEFIARFRQKAHLPILPEGTTLWACLNVKGKPSLPPGANAVLKRFEAVRHKLALDLPENRSSAPYSFVEVSFGPPNSRQLQLPALRAGGLWLTIEGNEPVGLTSSSIHLPDFIGAETCISLNHAFTRLSEVFEPWRLAHTGSVYDRFLYQEKDGKWYPLRLLRDAAQAKQEQAIAHDLWLRFLARMTPGRA